MIYQKSNFNKVAGVILMILVSALGYSQEAENLFHKDYSKLSFVLQPSYLRKTYTWNQYGTTYPSVEFSKDFSWQFGVWYNFAQSGRFNFKTGLIAKEFNPKFGLNVTKEDAGADLSSFEMNPYGGFIFSIPFKTDFYLNLSKKINMVVGAGINLNLMPGDNSPIATTVSVIEGNGNNKDIFYAYSGAQDDKDISMEFSVGLNYKAKFALIELSYYTNNISFGYGIPVHYEFMNLNQSPDTKGGFTIFNLYRGISLVISPKKGWLK